jgi:hypothetical protein
MRSNRAMSSRDAFLARWQADLVDRSPDDGLITQPFPGLRSFWQSEADLFFGRERHWSELLQELTRRRVTFVLGGSGSGKSSLVRAGVMPRLAVASVEPPAGAWYKVEFRPGEAPSSQLFEAIMTQIITPILTHDEGLVTDKTTYRYDAVRSALSVDFADSDPSSAHAACRQRLRQLLFNGEVIDVDALIEFADKELALLDNLLSRGAQAAAPNLLILIDQFEEAFDNKVRADDRDMLVSLIKAIWTRRPDRLYLMATMRSEELHRCSEFQGLVQVINASFYLVDLVEEVELDEVMTGPARRVLKAWGLDYDQPLTPNAITVLRQAYRDSANTSSSSDRLPLLQHFLTRVWRRAVERWSEGPASNPLRIDVSDIQAIDGWAGREPPLRGCLAAHADRVLTEAVGGATQVSPEAAESLLRAAFCTLARQDDRGNPKRSFASLDNMLTASGAAEREDAIVAPRLKSAAALCSELDRFVREGLIGTIREDGVEKYNVNHEALIRGWQRYEGWLGHARECEERLIEVDEKLHYREIGPSSLWLILTNLVLADRLRWAAVTVSDEASRLLDDVLGPTSTFSRHWARQVLARNDALMARSPARLP